MRYEGFGKIYEAGNFDIGKGGKWEDHGATCMSGGCSCSHDSDCYMSQKLIG